MIQGVPEKVREWVDAGYFVIGLTNQSNIESGFNTTADVVSAIKKTLDGLGMQFPVLFCFTQETSLCLIMILGNLWTGMIDAAIRDFGPANHTYSVMVGDDWEGADSGMARNAGVHFLGVLPFLHMSVADAEHQMYVMRRANERVELLNPDDLIRTFADQYDEILDVASYSAESSYSKSNTFKAGNTMAMKMSMGTILGVVGGLVLGYNAPALWDKYMGKESSAAEKAVESEQSLANQGFMEDWIGGNEGDDNLVSEGNQPTPAPISFSYDPLASTEATAYDPATRPPSMI